MRQFPEGSQQAQPRIDVVVALLEAAKANITRLQQAHPSVKPRPALEILMPAGQASTDTE